MGRQHDEGMALIEAQLGPEYDNSKVRQVMFLQASLRKAHAALCLKLHDGLIDGSQFVDEANRVHRSIAEQIEDVLGMQDFFKLFGMTPSEIGQFLDNESFLAR